MTICCVTLIFAAAAIFNLAYVDTETLDENAPKFGNPVYKFLNFFRKIIGDLGFTKIVDQNKNAFYSRK